ncbi:MAG: CHASE2 domain-containing protein, partial [Gammaproteobacteria bacterium]
MSKKQRIIQSNWIFGALFSATFLLVAVTTARPLFERFDLAAYDFAMRHSDATPSDRVVVVAIDEQSIRNIGRWPWSRDVLAHGVDLLEGYGARVIASTVLTSEPQIDPGLDVLRDLQQFFDESSLRRTVDEAVVGGSDAGSDTEFADDFQEMRGRLDRAIG